ncbi:hypothetical protein B0H11DRAFT_2226466 [Mycena galericulata]|nr:hypothetical protein B0H11DRAFT_2226466 [Mycena galericulata]
MDPSYRDLTLRAIRDLELDTHNTRDHQRGNECATCAHKNPTLRCLHCFAPEWLCSACMVEQHAKTPLHRIEMWTSSGLVGVTLKGAGLRIRLGHKLYDFCPSPIRDNDFVILDASGLHEVSLDYCGCDTAPTRGRQLLNARFYPSNDGAPRTAVAFSVAELMDPGAVPISMRPRRAAKPLFASSMHSPPRTGKPVKRRIKLNARPAARRVFVPESPSTERRRRRRRHLRDCEAKKEDVDWAAMDWGEPMLELLGSVSASMANDAPPEEPDTSLDSDWIDDYDEKPPREPNIIYIERDYVRGSEEGARIEREWEYMNDAARDPEEMAIVQRQLVKWEKEREKRKAREAAEGERREERKREREAQKAAVGERKRRKRSARAS